MGEGLKRARKSARATQTVRIRVKAGKTFRGVKYFEPALMDASPDLAKQAIAQGIAEPAPDRD